jgi:plasmid stabilization system protein ParE
VTYRVRFTADAKKDLDELYGFLLEKDLRGAGGALEAIEEALKLLERFSFSCRKAAEGRQGPFLRELIVSFGSAGYVVLFEIERRSTVTVLAVRHQRETDFY